MESVNWVPNCKTGCYALDIRWVVPVPGLTGTPSHRFALTTPEAVSRRYFFMFMLPVLARDAADRPRRVS